MKAGRFVFAAILACRVLPAWAETIEVVYDSGGRLTDYAARWAMHRREGAYVRVAGPCYSECTMLLGQIPRDHICVTPEASFGFHLANTPATTAALWKAYPTDIKAWISQHGGLTDEFLLLQAPDVQRFFPTCDAHTSLPAISTAR
jgi:hypothetical protein